MIKAVIFDVGGVLIRTENHAHRQKIEKTFGLSPGESDQIVFNSEMGQKAQMGEISDQELWTWIADTLQLGEESQTFQKGFWAGDVLDEPLIDTIRALRPKYQTAIISNATDGLRKSLTENHQIADAFDLIVVSAEERVMKPDATIYRLTMDRLGRKAEECIFIDDFPHNVDAARNLGMKTIHFQPGSNLTELLSDQGVFPLEH